MRRLLPLLLTLLTVLALVPGSPALGDHEVLQTTESLYAYNHNGTDCSARDGRLVYEPNPDGAGCGYIYGAPLGEVEHQTDQGLFPNVRTYTTEAGFGPVTLDGSREVTGVVTVTARQSFCASPTPAPCVGHSGVGSGAGEVIVDLAFGGLAADASQFEQAETIATTTVTATVLPGDTETAIPFTITLPADVDGQDFKALTLSTDVHGVHINTGYAVTDGRTTVDVPSLTPVPDEVCGNGIDDDGDGAVDEDC